MSKRHPLAERWWSRLRPASRGERVNKRRVDQFFEKVAAALGSQRQASGLLGLAFKANTDDIRFAPSLEVVRRLIAERRASTGV